MSSYLLALGLTLLIEGGVAYLLGFRSRREVLIVALVSLLTHPLLNYLLLILSYLGVSVTLGLITLLEIPVVVAEGYLLAYASGNPPRQCFITSLLMNGASFLVGVLLFWT
ncbi:MAG TPA: hypothetical protein PKH77_09885 [Anaerolineae bacterium]|nr:hypothetical protein [Anaerolineae bacterium]